MSIGPGKENGVYDLHLYANKIAAFLVLTRQRRSSSIILQQSGVTRPVHVLLKRSRP